MENHAASFRDPSGQVLVDGENVYRTIRAEYSRHWEAGQGAGFLERAVAQKWLTPFQEVEPLAGSWKTLRVDKIPFISYPYEWSFDQLRAAALLTLTLQREAVTAGLTLKDASAYNIQFCGAAPIFIDHLSFEKRAANAPWSAYRQFCMHFLAPLALCSEVDLSCGKLSRLWVDGVPLALAAKLMPWKARLKFGLLLHLFMHARMEKKHGDKEKSAAKARGARLTDPSLRNLVDHLADSIRAMRPPEARTEWGDYYADTNYSAAAEQCKLSHVDTVAQNCRARDLALDLGANTGRYSRVLAAHFGQVIAVDADPLAVNRHYLRLKSGGPGNILPLVLDLANPSPHLGWACQERESFPTRCRVDLLCALALIHHLAIGSGIPLTHLARHFAALVKPGGTLLLEFVPKQDSQMRRLLAVRDDVFQDYSLENMRAAFAVFFDEIQAAAIPDTVRTLHSFRKKCP